MSKSTCSIGPVQIGSGQLTLIAGPCLAESFELCLEIAQTLKDICGELEIGLIFKASYDKANRTSADSFRGPGLAQGLDWLAKVREKTSLPITSDIHDPAQAEPAAKVLDCLQIPAFLCRQTDLLIAAGATRKCVNIKKGQFMAPWDMANAVDKVRSTGNENVLLTERGTSFGYNRLVTDFRSIPQMQQFAPVVFDATHSVQEPGGLGTQSGGQSQFGPLLACAAIAAGADALFIETHPDPSKAKSDAATQMPLDQMNSLLRRCKAIFQAVRET